jgi:ribosomal protein S1
MTDQADEQLQNEIDRALDGINLQDLDLDQEAPDGKGRGPSLVKATVVGISKPDVILEIGPRSQGVCPLSDFDDMPKIGDVYDFTLAGSDDGLSVLSLKGALEIKSWMELEVGALVKARVTAVNTGGLEVKVGTNRGFIPASQVAIGRIDDLSTLLNQTLVCQVLELDRGKGKLVLSRRAVMATEADAARSEAMGALSPGSKIQGKVTRIEAFGAFCEISPGVEGLMHISNYSHIRIEDLNEHLKVGQDLRLMILDITDGGKRIGLGKKQLDPNPWDGISSRHGEDSMVTGKVTRIMDFGAFVEIEPGVEGLIHVSKLAIGRTTNVSNVVTVGEELTVRITDVDEMGRRLSLSRLDASGALLGSDEATDTDAVRKTLEENEFSPRGLNLGALLKRAMNDDG